MPEATGTNSARLGLPFIQPAQAQKHVTHNEAIQGLDAIVQLVLVRRDATVAPADPAHGAVYALGIGAQGVWAGRDGQLGAWHNGGWQFYTPLEGWRAWDLDTQRGYVLRAGVWEGQGGDSDTLDSLGIATSADAVNRLTVASEATLLTHAGAGHQLKLNKATPQDTASLLYQTGFDGRAEMGLAGEDAFSIKVRAPGGAWAQALRLDPVAQSVTVATGGGVQARLTQSGLSVDRSAGGLADWRDVYDQSNVVGTVSQTEGRITGALFERGANANGEYIRYADGTQICTRYVVHDSASGVPADYAMPAAFAAQSDPASSIGLRDSVQIHRVRDFIETAIAADSTVWRVRSAYAGTNTASQFILCAIGRWF